ncbi:MAG: PHP-associated domain-containing protein [Candidatus Sigynarchaeota archaeon]
MPFHQFKTAEKLPAAEKGGPTWNPMDAILGKAMVKLGLDKIATYFARYAKDWPNLKPWMPVGLDKDAFLLDCHCHTSLSDGEGDFESILALVGKGRYLDGLLFTDHVWSLGADGKTRIPNEKVLHQSYETGAIVEKLKKKNILPARFVSFPGCAEFVARGTSRFPTKGVELIGAGLPRTFIEDHGGLSRLRKLLAEDIVRLFHDDGGIAILVHPFYFENAYSDRLWRDVDAVEMVNQTTHMFVEPATRNFVRKVKGNVPLVDEAFRIQPLFGYFAWRARAELERHPRPVVGSSDAHVDVFAGTGCTWCKEPIESIEDFRRLLAKRNTEGILNPRWDELADIDRIIDAIWHHWGKKIVQTINHINTKYRAAIPVLKIATRFLKNIKDAPFHGE